MHGKPTYEELQQRVEKLEDGHERLRRLPDILPALVSYVDSDHCYQANNKAYEKWFGVHQDEIIGRHVKDVLGEEAYTVIKPHIQKALSGDSVSFEDSVHYINGGKRDILADYIPDLDKRGNVAGFYALVNDITKFKQLEAELENGKARMKLALEGTDEGTWDWDIQSGQITFSENWPEILGYEAGERNFNFGWWKQSLHPDSLPVFARALQDYHEGKEKYFELEYQIRDKSGNWRWIWTRMAIL